MFEKMNKTAILNSYYSVREQYLTDLNINLSDEVQKHLHRGLLPRIAMMEETVVVLYEELDKVKTKLDPYLATRLSLLLNSYYLNLAGSLDNLAWALTYHNNLLEDVDEDNFKHRKFVQLLGNDFLKKLRQKSSEKLAGELEPFNQWYKEIKELRDPAAHRIPLFVPSSIFSEEDVKQFQILDKKAAKLIAKGEWDIGMKFIHDSHQLGEFSPVFVSETSQIRLRDIAGQINFDHENWDKIVKSVFKLGFA